MAERLKPGERRATAPNRETGMSWVTVSREEAHAHPKGQLNWLIYLIIVYFAVVAGLKAWVVTQFGGGALLMLGASVLPLLTAGLLWLRAALARVLVVASGILTVFQTMNSGFRGLAELGMGSALYGLAEIVIILVITIYMWEGERPNLIYANRYRRYEGTDTPGDEAS
ncbi:hypothetical protein [Marimonas lutisalis]|uniref:hypothetical protein n=1 Tax=Marimonas lutisalis TaxID=2545756 RepID=UPI0010F8FC20|nr:hypothetical protein [Marimonas lutisalis]